MTEVYFRTDSLAYKAQPVNKKFTQILKDLCIFLPCILVKDLRAKTF